MMDEAPDEALERARILASLGLATRRLARSAATVDGWLIKAHAQGASYGEIARATGWDRRTVSRYLAKLKMLEDYEAAFAAASGERTITTEGFDHGDA